MQQEWGQIKEVLTELWCVRQRKRREEDIKIYIRGIRSDEGCCGADSGFW